MNSRIGPRPNVKTVYRKPKPVANPSSPQVKAPPTQQQDPFTQHQTGRAILNNNPNGDRIIDVIVP